MSGNDGFKHWLTWMLAATFLGGTFVTGITNAVNEKVDEIENGVSSIGKKLPDVDKPTRAGCERAHAVDGDTIKATCDGKRVTVRMIGLDAPESKRPGVPVECLAKDAAASLARMVDGAKRVRLVQDASQDQEDRYGRTLAYVEVDGQDAGLAQVRSGFARVYVYRGKRFARYRRYVKAEDAAARERRGIWRSCGGDNHAS
jgi:micrococcal nuclease